MLDIHTIIIGSIILGTFIGIADYLKDPLLWLASRAAFGIYYFLLIHKAFTTFLNAILR
ncbi:hypothetical protein [Microcoleus sp. FACHB-672]|uniref:hypothetical protein n=1 Tax=Microcoleus sp. FACHB-672 TaxID=2692825 RepID=UPI0016866B89|nr:hypothetical protein [Microcoleus sp. FACHB-672]MBD2039256.1 hypothetical protein [Microcoleus sp. FACHB-672]